MSCTKTFDEDRAVNAAVDCFWARGYEATSVRDLAEAMGIGGASLYNARGDKGELFVLALERYPNHSVRERLARIETRYPPKDAIGAFLAEIIDRSAKGCPLVNSALDVASRDAEIGKAVAAYLGEIRAFFKRSLEAGRRTGGIAASLDFEVVSGHLLGIVLTIRMLGRTGAKRKVPVRVAQSALDLPRIPARPSPQRELS